jgi:hypothetical protein
MAKFTFSLEQTASEEDLVYRGSDSIVWDRINAERLRRGLPSLTDIGLPRPADDIELTGTTFPPAADDGDSVTIEGEGLTREQALQIFQQQNSAGSFVGLKPGQSINASTQVLAGLKSAQAQVASGLGSGLTARLPGIDSVKQLQGLTAGLPVTDGINIGDIAKQAPALTGIDQASVTQVTGALSQAAKLTGQASNQISNTAGVGKYGLDVPQLETAGYIKPGTAEKYLATGVNTVTDVLKSPTVWTGKDNINAQSGFLDNVSTQDLVQTGLMVAGVAGLKSNGVATQILGGAALAGSALVAAKGVAGAVDWIKGGLPAVDTTKLNQLARDGEFGATFGEDKISDAMKKQFPALPAVNTTDRATLNAAAGRVLGNDKIPDLNFSVPAAPSSGELVDRLNQLFERFNTLRDDAGVLEGRIARTRIPEFINEQYDNLDSGEQLLSDLTGIKNQLLGLQREAEAKDPPAQIIVSQIESIAVAAAITQLETALERLRQRLSTGAQA